MSHQLNLAIRPSHKRAGGGGLTSLSNDFLRAGQTLIPKHIDALFDRQEYVYQFAGSCDRSWPFIVVAAVRLLPDIGDAFPPVMVVVVLLLFLTLLVRLGAHCVLRRICKTVDG